MKTHTAKIYVRLLASFLVLAFFLTSCEWIEIEFDYGEDYETDGNMSVHIIDVGQGDSIFAQLPQGQTLLIDAGSRGSEDIVIEYISAMGVDMLDYVVATHPHEDHIGGLDEVISAFEVGKVYMPDAAATSKTFEDLLDAIENSGCEVGTAFAGESLFDFQGVSAEFIAPNRNYDNLNDASAVIMLDYAGVSFLLAGDAESPSENDIIENYSGNLRADVLKIGHHGSETATSDEFLRQVSPSYAVISCGTGNSYGHPHEEVLDRLEMLRETQVYRTDLDGTVVFTTDGESIAVTTSG
ncbi:MAG: MBL fold metallo-hydrolase [Clostridiales bacterium]|nr:MBL fold metallo-hydrolase [Clostridiales bacterium]